GLRVTVLGIASNGEHSETEVAGARVIRVAVPLRITAYRQRRGIVGVLRRLRPGYAARDDAVAAKLMQGSLERGFRAERRRARLRSEATGREPALPALAWRRLHWAT